MTRPTDVTLVDEILSIRLYLSLAFPGDEIRDHRPQEDDPYTMLIEPVDSILSMKHNSYMTNRSMPVVVQRWCDDYMTAAKYVEEMDTLFRKGIAPGAKGMVPVWAWSDPTTPPDPAVDVPDRFLRVDDVESRILPGEKVGTHVAVTDVRLLGWRVIYDFTDTLIQSVNKQYDPEA